MMFGGTVVRRWGGLLLASAALLGFPNGPARAQSADTIVVNTTTDAPDAAPDGVCAANLPAAQRCTLRAAIMEANALGGPQTIQVPVGTYRLTIPGRLEENSRTGDLDLMSDLTIAGVAGATKARPVIDATGLVDRIFDMPGALPRTVLLQNMVMRGGDARQDEDDLTGGGIYISSPSSVTIQGSVIEGNTAELGGGIAVSNRDANLNLVDSQVQNNEARFTGGGVFTRSPLTTISGTTISGNRAPTGAGIRVSNKSLSSPRLTIRQSAITGNSATVEGGGIRSDAGSTVSLVASTISGNTAQRGGGLHASGPLLLLGATIAQNGNEGIRAASFTANNTIIANNGGADCAFQNASDAIAGAGNLSGGKSCRFAQPASNLANLNPLLGPLALNGGTTQTHKLLPGSPAIDAGIGSCTKIDQRGVTRPQGARCDIGAYEVPASEPPAPTAGPTSTPRPPKTTLTPIPPIPPRPTAATE